MFEPLPTSLAAALGALLDGDCCRYGLALDSLLPVVGEVDLEILLAVEPGPVSSEG